MNGLEKLLEKEEGVSLATVLSILGEESDTWVSIDINGQFCGIDSEGENEECGVFWNLKQDDYEDQEEETKEFITKLLKKNEASHI